MFCHRVFLEQSVLILALGGVQSCARQESFRSSIFNCLFGRLLLMLLILRGCLLWKTLNWLYNWFSSFIIYFVFMRRSSWYWVRQFRFIFLSFNRLFRRYWELVLRRFKFRFDLLNLFLWGIGRLGYVVLVTVLIDSVKAHRAAGILITACESDLALEVGSTARLRRHTVTLPCSLIHLWLFCLIHALSICMPDLSARSRRAEHVVIDQDSEFRESLGKFNAMLLRSIKFFQSSIRFQVIPTKFLLIKRLY